MISIKTMHPGMNGIGILATILAKDPNKADSTPSIPDAALFNGPAPRPIARNSSC